MYTLIYKENSLSTLPVRTRVSFY